jgi:transposase
MAPVHLEEVTMGSALGLREDFDGAALRRLARATKSANQARRLFALAEIYDGGSRTAAARIGGVGLQIVRDWGVRFNARGPGGRLDGKAPGRRSRLSDAQRRALVETVERGPIPAIHGVVRWRLIDQVEWLHYEFAVSLDEGWMKALKQSLLSAPYSARVVDRLAGELVVVDCLESLMVDKHHNNLAMSECKLKID